MISKRKFMGHANEYTYECMQLEFMNGVKESGGSLPYISTTNCLDIYTTLFKLTHPCMVT